MKLFALISATIFLAFRPAHADNRLIYCGTDASGCKVYRDTLTLTKAIDTGDAVMYTFRLKRVGSDDLEKWTHIQLWNRWEYDEFPAPGCTGVSKFILPDIDDPLKSAFLEIVEPRKRTTNKFKYLGSSANFRFYIDETFTFIMPVAGNKGFARLLTVDPKSGSQKLEDFEFEGATYSVYQGPRELREWKYIQPDSSLELLYRSVFKNYPR